MRHHERRADEQQTGANLPRHAKVLEDLVEQTDVVRAQ